MSTPETLIGDPLYPQLKEHVLKCTGLTYYIDKDEDLSRRIGRRISARRIEDCSRYLNLLRDPLDGPAELDALIAEITIGETYFFRHQEHFDALRDVVFPNLIARNRERKALRIWCAGCADGPEPYSLAILLKRSLAHDLVGWNISILGTDINRQCLARAREGRFEEWALRSTPDQLRQACFSKAGKFWTIAPEFREWVSFQYHNLVEDHFPSLVNNLSAFDLIVCRNVMIYFGPELMQRVIEQFHQCLVAGAWLLVGPTEPNMTQFKAFQTVNAPGVTLYHKAEACRAAAAPSGFPMLSLVPAPTLPQPVLSPVVESKPAIATFAQVREYANRGGWEEAARCCEALIQQNNLDSRVHFYNGLVMEQVNRHAEAEQALRRAIYLDRKAVLAHYYLGLFQQSRGELRQAARAFENVLELLRPRPDAEVFADADGITVRELRKLTEMHLEILGESEGARA